MREVKNKSYLQAYYSSDQTASSPVRVILNKVERPVLKEQQKRKGLYALGSH
ncbi:MAG: hypothetical protein SD837_09285 [Candidatus Electrothrix scaldis]|nr:MAG: hypothetical protein SD837_09285 [Candidatus Electrothrix sp. GW3-3]